LQRTNGRLIDDAGIDRYHNPSEAPRDVGGPAPSRGKTASKTDEKSQTVGRGGEELASRTRGRFSP